jgi:hypothetical protein
MVVMKRLLFLLGCSGALVCAADLNSVRNVYVMPMSRGLDQYLASRMASEGLFQVVTDPKLADAVFSDKVGETLRAQLETIFPTPKPESETDVEAKEEEKTDTADIGKSVAAGLTETENKTERPASAFGRSKGNIFLVEAKSRLVLWATYDPPKTNNARDLDRTASDIVSRIKKDLKKQK